MLGNIEVQEFMTKKFITLTPDMDALDAIQRLYSNRITGAPVMNLHGKIVGMFTEFDCMKVVLEASYNQDLGGVVSDYMSADAPTVDCETSIVEVAEKFSTTTARNFPVMEDVELVGIISRTDVLHALITLHG